MDGGLSHDVLLPRVGTTHPAQPRSFVSRCNGAACAELIVRLQRERGSDFVQRFLDRTDCVEAASAVVNRYGLAIEMTVSRRFSVFKLPSDPPHWSYNGR